MGPGGRCKQVDGRSDPVLVVGDRQAITSFDTLFALRNDHSAKQLFVHGKETQ